jgi:hypothetical protein
LEVLSGQVTIPGELRLTAIGLALDGRRPASFTMACLVMDARLVPGIKADGSMSTVWLAQPGHERVAPEVDQDRLLLMDRCRPTGVDPIIGGVGRLLSIVRRASTRR